MICEGCRLDYHEMCKGIPGKINACDCQHRNRNRTDVAPVPPGPKGGD